MRALLLTSALLGLVLMPGSEAEAGDSGQDRSPFEDLVEKDIQSMRDGHVVEFSDAVEGSDVKLGRAHGIVEDSPEAVLFVLLDIPHYKFWVGRLRGSRIIRLDGWNGTAVIESTLPWPAKDAWAYIRFTRTHKKGRVYELSWKMVNGTLKSYSGFARVEPWNKSGTKTLLTYKVHAVPDSNVPAAFLSNKMRYIAGNFIQRLRVRLKALRRFKKLPGEWGGER